MITDWETNFTDLQANDFGNPGKNKSGNILLGNHAVIFSDRAFFKGGGTFNPGERHSRDTRDDGTVTLCALHSATALSRNCGADFGRPLAKKVMSHSRDSPGVTAPSRTNTVPFTAVWNTSAGSKPTTEFAQPRLSSEGAQIWVCLFLHGHSRGSPS